MSRPGRAQRALATVAVLLTAALAGCGTAPPGRTSPEPTTPGPTTASGPNPTGAPTTTTPGFRVERFEGKRIKVPYGNGAAVSFTFDDGPSPTFTPQVLALLEQHHVPAVFCLIGNEARSYPNLVRQEVAAGFRLCDHSRDHDLDMNLKGRAYVSAEVDDGLTEIQQAAPGAPVDYYRQPGGFWSDKVVTAMYAKNLHPLRWSDDPRDWSRPGSLSIVRTVVKKLHPGAVILMHDGGGDRSESVQALGFLLTALVDAGWNPVLAPVVTLSRSEAAKQQ